MNIIHVLLPLSLTVSLTFAGDRNDIVQIGDFDYKGRVIRNAEARFITADKVQIGRNIVIPWDNLNATIQFKLKPLRERVGGELAAKEEAIKQGLVSVTGKVISVVETGCVVSCRDTPPPSDSLTRIGGHSVDTPLALPEASGIIFVRGIGGSADGESVNVKAMRTEEMFQYRAVSGALKTLRIYEVAN